MISKNKMFKIFKKRRTSYENASQYCAAYVYADLSQNREKREWIKKHYPEDYDYMKWSVKEILGEDYIKDK